MLIAKIVLSANKRWRCRRISLQCQLKTAPPDSHRGVWSHLHNLFQPIADRVNDTPFADANKAKGVYLQVDAFGADNILPTLD